MGSATQGAPCACLASASLGRGGKVNGAELTVGLNDLMGERSCSCEGLLQLLQALVVRDLGHPDPAGRRAHLFFGCVGWREHFIFTAPVQGKKLLSKGRRSVMYWG